MSDIRVVVPESLKTDVRAILKEQDLTVSQAVRLFLREVVAHRGLPFASARSQPNAATIAAMESSKHDENLVSYDSIDDLFASWDADQ
jgi:DNA-damage-inducible protein J